MSKKIDSLRKKYPEFVYRSYSYKYFGKLLKIFFYFEIRPDLKFKTEIKIKTPTKIDARGLDNLIFHLGLIEMLNYWKLTCSPNLYIEAGNLDKTQIQILRKILLSGMGQYFYENKIDFTQKNFLNIIVNNIKPHLPTLKINLNKRRILIPVGGGKDTPVTIELLRSKDNHLGALILNPKKPQLDITRIAGLGSAVIAKRKIDKKLLALNKKGFLNGHVPFSAFLAFLSLIVAKTSRYQRIAFSWEKNSSEPNLKYKGKWVNHQWSKSEQFEKIFLDYARKYLINNVDIFSPVRKLSDLQIAQIFSKLEQYHYAFLSCNNAYKLTGGQQRWCGKCPKCLSIFLYLYPFINEKKLIRIFHKNLFKDKKLILLMEQLIGKKDFKPFECVGTIKENRKAFMLAKKISGGKDFLLKNIA